MTSAKQWQQHWHEMFDADPPKENDSEWSQPLPPMGEDFRLLTGLAWTSPETRKSCFSVLPNGQSMWERLEVFLSETRSAMSNEAAAAEFDQQMALFAEFGISVQTDTPLRFIAPTEKSVTDAFQSADTLDYF